MPTTYAHSVHGQMKFGPLKMVPIMRRLPTSTSCVEMQIEASIEELAQEGMEARLAAAQADSDQAQAACQQAAVAVEAAERELAGAQAGDGRDESNRSLQERLADAQNAQVLCTPCQPLNTLDKLISGCINALLTKHCNSLFKACRSICHDMFLSHS